MGNVAYLKFTERRKSNQKIIGGCRATDPQENNVIAFPLVVAQIEKSNVITLLEQHGVDIKSKQAIEDADIIQKLIDTAVNRNNRSTKQARSSAILDSIKLAYGDMLTDDCDDVMADLLNDLK